MAYSNFDLVDAVEAKMQDPVCREVGLIPYTGDPLTARLEIRWIIGLPLSKRDETHQFSIGLRQIAEDQKDPRWQETWNKLQAFLCPGLG